MKIYSIKKRKKKEKSHVGEIGPMYVGKGWKKYRKLDTRLEPAHRYTLQETGLDFPVIEKKS
jgi:hypothetical protein